MELIEDVKIFAPDINLKERLVLSSGFELATEPVDDIPYEDHAFKYRKPWRWTTDQELSILSTNDPQRDYSDTIRIFRLPSEIIEKIEKLGIPKATKDEHYVEIRKKNPRLFIETMEDLYSFKKSFLARRELFHKLQVSFFRWDWHTVAINFNNEPFKFVGMHLDAWDGKTLKNCAVASNRISVNLGSQARYFLFVNLTVRKMHDLLVSGKNINIGIDTNSQDELARSFVNNYFEYPVTRIKLEPYEAYIAPTENIIHDGSTEPMDDVDISLTTRGYFRITNER